MRDSRGGREAPSAPKLGAANSTADRAIDILLVFSEERPIWSAAEIAAHFAMPRSTTYRYVNSLRSYALIVEDESGGYHLGPKIFPLARVAKASTSILSVAAPELRKLNDRYGEAVSLYQRVGDKLISVEHIESRHPVRITFPRADMLPWPATASAKVLLAFANRADKEAIFRLIEPVRYTSRTITSRKALRTVLEKIRRDGYAFSDEEREEGVRAIAAPVFVRDEAHYNVTLSGLTFRFTDERLPEIISSVRSTAAAISDAIASTDY